MVLYLFLILTLCFSFCFWFLIKWFGSDSGVNIANKLFPTGDTNDRESYYWLLVISNYWGSSLSWVKDNRNSILLVFYVDLLVQEHISYPWKTGQKLQISTSEFSVYLFLNHGWGWRIEVESSVSNEKGLHLLSSVYNVFLYLECINKLLIMSKVNEYVVDCSGEIANHIHSNIPRFQEKSRNWTSEI